MSNAMYVNQDAHHSNVNLSLNVKQNNLHHPYVTVSLNLINQDVQFSYIYLRQNVNQDS